MLLFFTFTTVFGLSKFHNHQYQCVVVPERTLRPTDHSRSFSIDWWFWLTFTGFSIGCVSRYATSVSIRRLANVAIQSVKLIGLFVTALVGLYTIEDLWNKFGDLRMPVVRKSCLLSCAVRD
jgi:dolichyl-phosphate-mannose-protein mannosyltransferase